MKYIRFLIVAGFLLRVCNCFAQTDTSFLNRAVISLEKYADTKPAEKVHLHLNKTSYTPGDTIWFKAYAVAGQNHGLSAISNVLHVELLTDKDSVVNRLAIPLANGVGWGDFALPFLIKTGNYQVRAYTNWMRNFSPEYFFDQPIQVNEVQTSITTKKQKSGEPDIQFFAEGGPLINGLRSKVAIKALGVNGIGEDIEGSVVDNDGNEVAIFSTQHLGMGLFALLPQMGKTYKAKITRKNGKQFMVALPKALDEGFTIAVNNSQTDSVRIRVASSAKLFDVKKNAKYYLVAQLGGKVYFTSAFTLSVPSFITQIDKKRFPTGIVQFTLFADNGEPLNERIAFIQHNDGLKLDVVANKSIWLTREKVNITLKANDKDSKPVVGSFSATVINEDLSDENARLENGILSNLLLTSDIKGYIEQPNYYFNNVNDKTSADLDLLMLTQGYHRFEWKQVLGNNNPELNYEPEKSLSVTGYLKTFGGKAIPKGKILLYSTRGGWFKMDTTSNEQGRFTFKELISDPDSTIKYVMQARTQADKKKLDITLDTIADFKSLKDNKTFYINQNDTTTLSPYQLQMKRQLKISLDKRMITLKEVVIKATKEPLRWGILDPDQTVRDFPKEGNGQTLSQYLSVRLRGVYFVNGVPYSTRGQAKMSIMFNGVLVDEYFFQSIQLTDVEGVQVLRTTGKRDLLTGTFNVIIITSKQGRSAFVKEQIPNVITYRSNGFYKSRVFYSPKYDGPKTNAQTLDLRTTIYWKPDIITDKDGNATLSFYNSDTRGTYRVTVEGIDIDGNIGKQIYTYRVE